MVTAENLAALGMVIKTDNPAEVGEDRVINAMAAFARCSGEAIIIDFGTATTFDVVDEQGAYCGGVIAPGINLSLDALQKAAARLPNIAIKKPQKVVGTSTVEAMQSGLYYGYLGLIERIVTEIRQQTGMQGRVLATGGLAPLFAAASETIDELVENLTLEGLNLFAQRYKESHEL